MAVFQVFVCILKSMELKNLIEHNIINEIIQALKKLLWENQKNFILNVNNNNKRLRVNKELNIF